MGDAASDEAPETEEAMSHKAQKRRRAWKKALKRVATRPVGLNDGAEDVVKTVLRDVKRGELRFVCDIRDALGVKLAEAVAARL